MIRSLLALLILQTVAIAQAPAVEVVAMDAVRGKLRPSLVEISRRVLAYSAEGDFIRATKAAIYLAPLELELKKLHASNKTQREPLAQALESQDLLRIRESLHNLVLADIHYLLAHLQPPLQRHGITPRTRLLMAQQDLKFLETRISKDPTGQRVRLALDKLFQVLIQTVPHKVEYGRGKEAWIIQAAQYGKKILLLLDSVVMNPSSKAVQR